MIAYNLCGWDFKDGSISSQFFSKWLQYIIIFLNLNFILLWSFSLENGNEFERASCLAVLTHNYEKALEILDNASKSGIY